MLQCHLGRTVTLTLRHHFHTLYFSTMWQYLSGRKQTLGATTKQASLSFCSFSKLRGSKCNSGE